MMHKSLLTNTSFLLLALAMTTLAFTLDSYYLLVLTLFASTVIVGVGLNILMGLVGQISFGHIAFYAIGAYASGLLMMAGVPFPIALIGATLISAAVGALLALPALRVQGPYLAMITIAFAFIVHHGIMEWRSLTGGANGLIGFPLPDINMDVGVMLAALTSLLLVASLYLYRQLHHSEWGCAMRAVKNSEIAARSLGFNPIKIKTLAFALSAGLTGLAGSILPPLMMFISPSSFPFSQSILFVFAVIIGGTGTLFGPFVGALIIVLLPEVLAPLAEYRLLIFAALLLFVLLVAPTGLLGVIQKRLTKRRAVTAPTSADHALLSEFYQLDTDNSVGLEVNGIGINFGGVKAADNVSFNAPLGTISSIIGPNGAGKTTVLNMVSGFYKPDSGSIRLGKELLGKPAQYIAQAGIARTYQTTQLFSEMTVLENLLTAMQQGNLGSPIVRRQPNKEKLALNLLSLVGYKGSIYSLASELAHVDRRLVEIARALATKPKVLLLDEPAAGLSRNDTDIMAGLLKIIASYGIAVILVEHDMSLVMEVSENILVLDSGSPIANGAAEQIQRNPAVISAYLGATEYQAPPREEPWSGEKVATLFAKGLTIDYGAAPVVDDISFVVYPGEMVAILGANGAGKSSIMQALAGLHRPVKGSLLLNNEEMKHQEANYIAQKGLALAPEGRQLFGELSVLDNLLLGANCRGQTTDLDQEVEVILNRFPRLRDRLHSQAGLLSGGEQQMVAVGRALMAKPSILLLDEPSLGLAPSMIAELFDALASLRDEGVTILLVDQMANLALQVVDRAYVMETGRIIKEGTAAQLQKDESLAAAYLGDI